MNIFAVDTNTKKCAEYHVDKHVHKMVVEYTQCLCTVVRERVRPDLPGYPRFYESVFETWGPTKWAGSSSDNWHWLLGLALHLQDEYVYRFGRYNASYRVLYRISKYSNSIVLALPPKGLTPFYRQMSKQWKESVEDQTVEGAVEAYRNCYRFQKRKLHKWTNRPVPWWIDKEL